MNHEIQGQRDAVCSHPLDDLEFLLQRSSACNFTCGILLRALKTQLQVIESGIHEFREPPQVGEVDLLAGRRGG